MLLPVPSRRPLVTRSRPHKRGVRGFGDYTNVALAVQKQEGYYPGSIAYTNNNPGNLMYAGQAGAIGKDANGFAVFPDYATGFQALLNQISLDANRGMTISQFTASYAPASVPGNNPGVYATNIANATGLSPTDLLSQASDASGASPIPAVLPDLSSLDLSSLTGNFDPTTIPDWAWLAAGLVGIVVLAKSLD